MHVQASDRGSIAIRWSQDIQRGDWPTAMLRKVDSFTNAKSSHKWKMQTKSKSIAVNRCAREFESSLRKLRYVTPCCGIILALELSEFKCDRVCSR